MPVPTRRTVTAALAAVAVLAGCSATSQPHTASATRTAPSTTAAPTPAPAASTPGPAATPAPTSHPARPTVTRTYARVPRPRPTPKPAPVLPATLPDRMADTGGAGQLVTVTNGGSGNAATLQAFARRGGRWASAFGPFAVKIGADGFSHGVSEQTVASPIGMFTLTEAFGNDADPGVRLPYHRVRYGDVWVDQSSSPHYNTLQTGDAGSARGSGEKLWEVRPGYDYAVVIGYNRAPVRPGARSAFFLHVTIPEPSAGCVTMPVDRLVALMRWLDPTQHPRIAMGPLSDVLGM